MAKNNYNFKTKSEINPRIILSIVACILGFASLIFLASTGIVFKYTQKPGTSNLILGCLTWGGGDFGSPISAGLVCAFFFTIGGALIVLGVGGFHYIGFLSFLLFLTSGVLYFCSVPLCASALATVGAGYGVLGWGSYVAGILNVFAAAVSFLAARGD
jgi:hypothetical protein